MVPTPSTPTAFPVKIKSSIFLQLSRNEMTHSVDRPCAEFLPQAGAWTAESKDDRFLPFLSATESRVAEPKDINPMQGLLVALEMRKWEPLLPWQG